MSKKRYLKTWMGVTSGPTDYGYPERQIFIIEDLDTLVRTYNADADYYRLSSVDVAPVVAVAKELEENDGRL